MTPFLPNCSLNLKKFLPPDELATRTDGIELHRGELQTNSLSLYRFRPSESGWNCQGETINAESAALKEPAEERRRFIRDAGNLVRCLTIEFEIELG